MKKVLKIAAICIFSIIAAIVIAFAVLYFAKPDLVKAVYKGLTASGDDIQADIEKNDKELVDKIGLTDTSSAINSHKLRPRRLVNLLQQSHLTLSSYNSIKSTHTCKLYILLGANIQLFLGKHKQNAKVYYANAIF